MQYIHDAFWLFLKVLDIAYRIMISCRENEEYLSYLNPFPHRPDMILSKFLVKSVKLGQPTKADPGWKIEGNDDFFFYLTTCFYLKLLSKQQISNAKYTPKHQATNYMDNWSSVPFFVSLWGTDWVQGFSSPHIVRTPVGQTKLDLEVTAIELAFGDGGGHWGYVSTPGLHNYYNWLVYKIILFRKYF